MATGVLTMALGKATKFLQVSQLAVSYIEIAPIRLKRFSHVLVASLFCVCVCALNAAVPDVGQGVHGRDPLWSDHQLGRHHWAR
jgi:hypothetical protein